MRITGRKGQARFVRAVILALVIIPGGRAVAQTCVPPSVGLVAWWPGDGDANDAKGSFHGTLRNGAGFAVAGKVAYAFNLDGIDDFVEIGDFGELETSGTGSVMAWIRGSAGAVVTKYRDDTPEDGWSLRVLDDGRVEGIIKSSETPTGEKGIGPVLVSSAVVNDGLFHHLAMTWGGGAVVLYIDGQADKTGLFSGSFLGNSRPVYIGRRNNQLDQMIIPFRGLIDEVAFFNRSLTEAEIQAYIKMCLSADVSVGKAGPKSVAPGTYITYRLTVINSGPSDAVDVRLEESPPARLTFVSASGACTDLPCIIRTLPARTGKTVDASYLVGPGPNESIVNTVTVSSVTPDPNTSNNTTEATTYVSCPDTAPREPVPANGSRGVPTAGLLSWWQVGAASYTVFLDVAGRGCNQVLGSVTGKAIGYGPLEPGTTYEWRIEARSPGCEPKSSPCFSFTTGAPVLEIKQSRDPEGIIEPNPPGMGFVPHERKWIRVTYTLTVTNVGDGETQGQIQVYSNLGRKTNIDESKIIRKFRRASGALLCEVTVCVTNEILKPDESRTFQLDLESDVIDRVRIEHFGVVTGGGARTAASDPDLIKMDERLIPQTPETPTPTTGRKR